MNFLQQFFFSIASSLLLAPLLLWAMHGDFRNPYSCLMGAFAGSWIGWLIYLAVRKTTKARGTK